jgi:hypothetical protein
LKRVGQEEAREVTSSNGTSSNIKHDTQFNTMIINVNSLEALYREFFKTQHQHGGYNDKQESSLEGNKSRCFKDLYNMIEESTIKFYELYVDW